MTRRRAVVPCADIRKWALDFARAHDRKPTIKEASAQFGMDYKRFDVSMRYHDMRPLFFTRPYKREGLIRKALTVQSVIRAAYPDRFRGRS